MIKTTLGLIFTTNAKTPPKAQKMNALVTLFEIGILPLSHRYKVTIFLATLINQNNHGNQGEWGQNEPHLKFLRHTLHCDSVRTVIRIPKHTVNVLVPNGLLS